ncbi:MAG: hypothetical protein U9Q04_07085 [Campylobacterota bacterium]|nr:hypothetical protein [Campylobacterota bacterium]
MEYLKTQYGEYVCLSTVTEIKIVEEHNAYLVKAFSTAVKSRGEFIIKAFGLSQYKEAEEWIESLVEVVNVDYNHEEWLSKRKENHKEEK